MLNKLFSEYSRKDYKVCPEYAKDYKKEFIFIQGIDKCFEYYNKNINKGGSGVFKKRLNTIKKYLRNFDRFHFPLYEIDKNDVNNSLLLEQLNNFSDYYIADDGSYEFYEEMFLENIDIDFPGWSDLKEAVTLFHSKF